jgi:hypothetical protein
MRKGVIDQVFIYIFAVIVIAFILYFGFTQIVNLKNLSEKSVYITFKNDFESAVNDVYYKNPNSVLEFSINSRNKPLELPKDVEKVCFNDEEVSFRPLLLYDEFIVEHLKGSENECINVVRGRLRFKLTNDADGENTFVKVSDVGTE